MKRTAIALGLLFLFDLGFMGQGLFSLAVSLVGTAVLAVRSLWALLRGRHALAGTRALKAGMYLLLLPATVGALWFHAHTAETGAARIIAACRAYEARRGTLPDRLQDLTPDFLPSVPRAKYTLSFGDYTYWSTGGRHTLLYVAMPPFGRRLYHFEEDRWGTLD